MSKKIILVGLMSLLTASNGRLEGIIVDAVTQQPLMGVNVIVDRTSLGTATNKKGNFKIADIPVGSYNIHVSMIGYEPINRANIHIVPQRSTRANFYLNPIVLEGDDVIVTATFFEKTRDAINSSRTVNIEEIRSDPVGAYDIMAMMQSLPSVVSGADQVNEIIVRGGALGENLFIMDHLEIPYPNHYPDQGKGGGPITMVDTEFIERIDFYAGAFPVRYGEKLSSVMDVTLREGNRENDLGEISMNIAGFGLNLEGPASNNGSYMISLKRSFLDYIIASTGLQAVPEYWSGQGKLTYDLSPTQKLMFNYIGGIDIINVEGEENPALRSAENVDYESQQATAGITLKNLFSKKGYSILSLSKSYIRLNTDVYELDEEYLRDSYYQQRDLENEISFRGEVYYKIQPKIDVNAGLSLRMVNLDYDNWFETRPTILYGYSLDSSQALRFIEKDEFDAVYFQNPLAIITPLDTIGIVDTIKTNAILNYNKIGEFFHFSFQPFDALKIFVGSRFDYLDFTNEGTVSPRFCLSYNLSPAFSINASAGRYYQPPFNIYLNSVRGRPRSLKNYYADQAVVGLDFFPTSDTRVTLEVFNKEYDEMITFEVLVGSDGRDSLNYHNVINGGSGRSNGIELFIQKKYSNNWYGSLSWSHSVAEGLDPRYKKYYPWTYDYRDVVNIIGGYKIRYADYDWYNEFKKTFWAKGFSWLPFMPSDEYEISFKFRYMGGRPYTPKTYDHTIREWHVDSTQPWNTARYKPYVRLDLMLQQRFHFKQVNMVVFWNILNVFGRDNPWEYVYLKGGDKKMILQYKTVPIGGIIIEF